MQSCMMHVELRIACVESLSSFDAESFVRMHQLGEAPERASDLKQSLVRLPHGGADADDSFRPRIKVEFVFKDLVCIRSSSVEAVPERVQHEEQVRSGWDASEIRTKRYHCSFSEVIVASLPHLVVERDVKIRALQLPPALNGEAVDAVRACFPRYLDHEEPCLCIGVAKISLRDLISTGSGVSVALQPKRSMVSAVEALNLNTVATNTMFGKDAGGSGVLTFQVVGVVFNPKAFSSILSRPVRNGNAAPTLLLDNGMRTDNAARSVALTNFGVEMGADGFVGLRRQMNSDAVHFVLVPYMVLVDSILRFNDALSWRNPIKTLLLLFIISVVLSAEVVDVSLILVAVLEIINMLRVMIFFYRIPSCVDTGSNPVEFSAERKGTFQAVVYSSHNHIINSLIRARLFFTQGMQSDSYFELVYLFSRLKRWKRSILPLVVTLLFGSLLFAVETMALLGVLLAFFVYPLLLRFSVSRLRRTWRRQLRPGNLRKTLLLSRPMCVSRVIQVVGPQERSVSAQNLIGSMSRFSAQREVDEQRVVADLSTTFVPDRPIGLGGDDEQRLFAPLTDIHRLRQPIASHAAENSLSCFGARTVSAFAGNSPQVPAYRSKQVARKPEDMRHEYHQAVRLSFVTIVMASEVLPGAHSRTTSISGCSTSGSLAQRLRRVLQRANTLGRPPPAHLLRSQYQSYFNAVLTFLQFVGRQCTLDAYTSCSPFAPPADLTGGTVMLDQVAPLCNLLEVGRDDGITSTFIAYSGQQVVLSKLQSSCGAESSARSLALLAAYLLQGSRLSVYSDPGGRSCSVIIPLKMDDNDIEMAPDPHPCPLPLQKALVGFWKGLAGGDCNIDISPDVVLTVITTYKDAWSSHSAIMDSVNECNHIVAGQLDENNSTRDTTKRLLHSFNATRNSKRYSIETVEPPPLDIADRELFLKHAGLTRRADDTDVSPKNYHRATRTWA